MKDPFLKSSRYMAFLKGKNLTKPRINGVGFPIKSFFLSKLPSLLIGINEWLMDLCLPLTLLRHVTIICFRSTPPTDKLILLSDLNARMGSNHFNWDGALGLHGIGQTNSNGMLLLANVHNLLIPNNVMRQGNKYNTLWVHLGSKWSHPNVITCQCNIHHIKITRAMSD